MFMYHGSWHYDFTLDGKRYRGSTGTDDKKKAEKEVEKIRVQAREGHTLTMMWEQTKRRLVSFNDISLDADIIWDEFSKRSTTNAGNKRLRLYRLYLGMFVDFMHDNYPNVKKVSGVLPIHTETWFGEVKKQKLASSTKNDYIKSVRFIFSSLGKDCGIVEDPFAGVKRLKKTQITREAFIPEELELIGKNATGWMYSLCLTAISTGLREGDICTLKKSYVDLDKGWISIPQTRKTGVNVDIPILPGLRKHLQEVMFENDDSEYVFPELAEMYTVRNYKIGTKVKEFFNKIGITNTTVKVDGYAKKISTKDIHSFRHTFVYLAGCHGVPFPIVQGIVGHMNPAMTKHYMDHAGRDAKAQYMAQLPDYLSGQKEIAPKPNTLERVKKIVADMNATTWQEDRETLLSLLPLL